jgi:hypothetical protein
MPAVLSSLALPIGRVAAIAGGAGGTDRDTEGEWDATVLFVNGALAAVNTRAVGGADTQGSKPCLYERPGYPQFALCRRVFCLFAEVLKTRHFSEQSTPVFFGFCPSGWHLRCILRIPNKRMLRLMAYRLGGGAGADRRELADADWNGGPRRLAPRRAGAAEEGTRVLCINVAVNMPTHFAASELHK